jgi:hypothetical protein
MDYDDAYFREWGWLLFLNGGQVKIIAPMTASTHKHIKLSLMYQANVALRWHWTTEDMWVVKNRWGYNNCWLSTKGAVGQ